MDNGNVHIFDLNTKMFSKFKIDYKAQMPDQAATPVTDIKCHPLKMHRLLISFKEVCVGVFSINKNRFIQRIMLCNDVNPKPKVLKGLALAVEWIGPDYNEFLVGFNDSVVHVFKAESTSQRSVRRTTPIENFDCRAMELMSLERPVGYHYLVVKITKDKVLDAEEGVQDENSINDNETSEVFIVKGHNK
jgi:hypothetical protein